MLISKGLKVWGFKKASVATSPVNSFAFPIDKVLFWRFYKENSEINL